MSGTAYDEDWRLPLCQSCGLRRVTTGCASPYLCQACLDGPVLRGWCNDCEAPCEILDGACMTCTSRSVRRIAEPAGVWS